MTVTDTQLLSLMQSYLWVFTRIGAALMAAPLFGMKTLSMRIRLVLTLALTLLVTPMLPDTVALQPWSAEWFRVLAQQLLIGVCMGFLLQLCFEAVMLAGELISSSMGLGFARLADPVRGADAPVVGQFMGIFAMLLFLTLNGHVQFIAMIFKSFQSMPLETSLSLMQLKTLLAFSATMFAAAIQMALPAVISLLLVNLGFGVISRAAPSLNLMAVGFPLSLIGGLVILQFSMPGVQAAFTALLESGWMAMNELLRP